MSWWENLFAPLGYAPDVTVPIPPNLPGPMMPPNIPFKYGLRDQRTGDLHSAIFGSPYIPQFEQNTFKPGAVPGQMDVAPKPPLPPMTPRAPASMPMPGTLPPGQSPPGAMGMGDLSFPGAMTPASTTSASTRKPFDWGPDASLWPMLMQAGQGLMQPSPYGFSGQLQQGLAGASDAAQKAPMQKAQRRLLEAQAGEAETKESARKSAMELAKALPKDHPARPFFAFGMYEKGLEQLTPDWNKLIVTGPDGKPQLNATLMNAKAFIEGAGKWQWGVVGHDAGGKPIHGWVNPMQGAMPGASPGAPSASPSAVPGTGAAPTSGPPSTGIAQALPGQEAPIPKPPPGADPYKWAEDQTKLRIQQQQGAAARQKTAPIVIQDIDRALDRIKNQSDIWPQTGFGGMLTNQISANQTAKILQSVKANIGFDTLNQMRQQSPTGAALGAVQVEELRMLQSVYGSVEVSTTQKELAFNLKRFKNAMLDVIHGAGQGPAREKLDGPSARTGATKGGIKYRVVE